MTLEERLSDEEKSRILNEVERERREVLVYELYYNNLESRNKSIRTRTSEILSPLFKHAKISRCLPLIKDQLRQGGPFFPPSWEFLNSLSELVLGTQKKFSEIVDNLDNKNKKYILLGLMVYSSDKVVGEELSMLEIEERLTDTNLYQKVCERFQKYKQLQKLSVFANSSLTRFEELCEKEVDDVGRRNLIIKEVLTFNDENQLKSKKMPYQTFLSWKKTIKGKFDDIDNLVFLCEREYEKDEHEVRGGGKSPKSGLIFPSIKSKKEEFTNLAKKNPTQFRIKYDQLKDPVRLNLNYGMQMLDTNILLPELVETLGTLTSTLGDEILIPMEDNEYIFLKNYLDSNCVSPGSEKKIIHELKRLVQNSTIDYSNPTRILNYKIAQNLDEILTCAELTEELSSDKDKYPALDILTHKIGEGGNRECYSGLLKDPTKLGVDNPKVVISIMKKEKEKENRIKQFKKEIESLSKLRHNGIVTYKEYGQLDDGRYFLVMEQFGEGKNLEKYITEKGTLNKEQFERIFYGKRGIISALEYAHEGDFDIDSVYHGDLTIKNLLVKTDEKGNIARAAIGDWESVTYLEDELQPHKSLGSPAYIVPPRDDLLENEDYQNQLKEKIDRASLGICMYVSLTGMNPIFDQKFQDVKTGSNEDKRAYRTQKMEEMYQVWCQESLEERMTPLIKIIGEDKAGQIIKMIAQEE
jgi:serine/threonine protein kinase